MKGLTPSRLPRLAPSPPSPEPNPHHTTPMTHLATGVSAAHPLSSGVVVLMNPSSKEEKVGP